MQVIAVVLWGLAGVLMLLHLSLNDRLALAALAGFGALGIATIFFVFAQHAGMLGFLSRIGARLVPVQHWDNVHVSARQIDEIVREVRRILESAKG